MGVFTNVTTLVVLAVQGLKDSVNISLFALTLSDLAYVVTLLPGQQHCFYVAEDEVKANSLKQEFIPHGVMLGIAFSRVSAGITALISVERCLCVMLPLKVQRLVTYRCTLFAITSICLALLALFVPVLMMLEIQHVDIGGNRTAAYAVPTAFFRENFTLLSVFSDTVISVVIPVSLLAIVAVCTAVTVIRLKTSSKWRQAVSSASSDTAKSRTPSRSGSHVQTQEPVHVTRQQKPTSVDDKTVRLTRMMVAIACIYIVCIIPGTISTLVRLFIPEFSLNDRYHNMFAVVYALDFTMLTFNSSVNFFVYLAMSSSLV
nr:hypothetical protein BaRGS_026688 [Batillaria attramentaria]